MSRSQEVGVMFGSLARHHSRSLDNKRRNDPFENEGGGGRRGVAHSFKCTPRVCRICILLTHLFNCQLTTVNVFEIDLEPAAWFPRQQ